MKTLIKKEFRVKGKSKYVEFRPDLKAYPIYIVSTQFKIDQMNKIRENQIRREQKKINQERNPESFFKDCYVNSEEYKKKHNLK
jgi:hypothetical protein